MEVFHTGSITHMDFLSIKKEANLIRYLGVIFSKPEKLITYLKFARIQRPLNSEFIKLTQPLNSLSADLSLRYRNARHLSLVTHVPLMFLYKQRVVSWDK